MTGFAIGDVEVHPLVDMDLFEVDLSHIFPGREPDPLRAYDWLEPDHLDLARGIVKLGMHSFVLRANGLVILIDTCVGEMKERPALPAWHLRRETRYLAGLAALGLTVEDVDLVFCTHLHADHVGWNTRLDQGRWVPTFPKARYAISQTELADWQRVQAESPNPPNHGSMFDSVLPIVEAGQAMFVAPGDTFATGLSLVSLAGHTIDQMGLEVRRGDDHALFCGDAIHSPLQLPLPHWTSAFCSDPAHAIRTRLAMLERVVDENILLCPAHFRGPRAMRVSRANGAFLPREMA